jgi:hypothetical protein
MYDMKMKIQAVINTLDLLTMPPTYDNVNHMLGIYTTLVEVRDAIHEEKTEVVEDGKGDRVPD